MVVPDREVRHRLTQRFHARYRCRPRIGRGDGARQQRLIGDHLAILHVGIDVVAAKQEQLRFIGQHG
jgi:hypothetical protein